MPRASGIMLRAAASMPENAEFMFHAERNMIHAL